MNKMREEIKKSMVDFKEISKQELEAKFIFNKDFIGFKGHFPGQPILPGICKVQAVLVMYEQKNKYKIYLKELVNAKFFSPVSANQEIILSSKEEKIEEGISIKVKVNKETEKVAQMHLIVGGGS